MKIDPIEIKKLTTVRSAIAEQIEELTQYIDASFSEAERERESFRDIRSALKTKQMKGKIENINNMVEAASEKVRHVRNLKISFMSPYFAGLTFNDKEILIGQFSVFNPHEVDLYVNDWRAPISSLFYDYELGPASYKTEEGPVTGKINTKKQYKIEDGALIYCFDTELNIQDEILQETLARTTSNNMKTIVATIQKEQNQIIRTPKETTLVVQGVAGSGKTSIALHRIAYLLYNNRNSLTARNVLIFSPSRVFSGYIEEVLPSLGEGKIQEITFDDILSHAFDNLFEIEKKHEQLEALLENNAARSAAFLLKTQYAFLERLIQFLDRYLNSNFYIKNLKINRNEYSAAQIAKFYGQAAKGQGARYISFYERIEHAARGIAGLILIRRSLSWEQEENLVKQIINGLLRMQKAKNIVEIYKAFLKTCEGGLTFNNKEKVTQEDAFALFFIKNYIFGAGDYTHVQHLIIDEMQDYSPVQLAIISQMYGSCPKTILGDVHQIVNGEPRSSKLDDIMREFNNALLLRLNKSYRATYQLCEFSGSVLGSETVKIEAVKRNGPKPRLIKAEQNNLTAAALEEIKNYQKACKTICIITKTGLEARRVYEELSGKIEELNLISHKSLAFNSGVSVSPAYLAKGLEFDAIVMYNVNKENYSTEIERQSLYAGVTRALHYASLIYSGELSGFINEELCERG